MELFKSTPELELTFLVPRDLNLFLPGGRSSGKSTCLAGHIVRDVHEFGSNCKAGYFRQSHSSNLDFVHNIALPMMTAAFGPSVRFNSQNHCFSNLPGGAHVEVQQLQNRADFVRKLQGRSYHLLALDELGDWPDLDLVELMRSNLRSRVPTRMILAANPGGRNHGELARRFVLNGASDGEIFTDEKSDLEFVRFGSTVDGNPFVDREAVIRNLEAMRSLDPELFKGWRFNDWTISAGAFFPNLDQRRVGFDPISPEQLRETVAGGMPSHGDPVILAMRRKLKLYWAIDWGSAAPAVGLVLAVSPGFELPDGRWVARDSILVFDEVSTADPTDLNRGLGCSVPRFCEEILEVSRRWNMRPEGVADDACFAKHGHESGSLADEFRRSGVFLSPARKGDRVQGWQTLKRLFEDAGEPDKPALYVSKGCAYFWRTAPFIARDPRRPDDLDSRGADHALDALRYGALYERPRGHSQELRL